MAILDRFIVFAMLIMVGTPKKEGFRVDVERNAWQSFKDFKYDKESNKSVVDHIENHLNDKLKTSKLPGSSLLEDKFMSLAKNVNGKTVRADMLNMMNTNYVGKLYFSNNIKQPAELVFDTGSNWLAVISDLCTSCSGGDIAYFTNKSTSKEKVSDTLVE